MIAIGGVPVPHAGCEFRTAHTNIGAGIVSFCLHCILVCHTDSLARCAVVVWTTRNTSMLSMVEVGNNNYFFFTNGSETSGIVGVWQSEVKDVLEPHHHALTTTICLSRSNLICNLKSTEGKRQAANAPISQDLCRLLLQLSS